MRILFTGDWQARVDNLDRCRLVVDQIIGLVKRFKEPCAVVHLGDIKDAMNPVDQRVTNFILESSQHIVREAFCFAFVRGNHDSITTQDGVPSCVPVVHAANVVVADGDWRLLELGYEILLWMVPYFRDSARQKKAFAEAAKDAQQKKYHDKVRILAFHNEVTGCERSAYSKGTGLTLDEVGTSAYSLCVSGHIHRPQIVYRPSSLRGVGNPQADPSGRVLAIPSCQGTASYSMHARADGAVPIPGAVYFVGSPFAVDWGECNEQKRFLVLEIQQ